MFLQDQGRKPSKTPLFILSFSQCVENNIFCDDFFDEGVEMYCKYQYFIHFYCFQLPKQTSHAQMYLQSVLWQGKILKYTMFLKQFLTCFQLVLLNAKNNHFWMRFCHRSSGLKKA